MQNRTTEGKDVVFDPVKWIQDNWAEMICKESPEGYIFKMWQAVNAAKAGGPKVLGWWVAKEAAWAALRISICPGQKEDIPDNPEDFIYTGQCVEPYGPMRVECRKDPLYLKYVDLPQVGMCKQILQSQTNTDHAWVQYIDDRDLVQTYTYFENDSDYWRGSFTFELQTIKNGNRCGEVDAGPNPDPPPPIPIPQEEDECEWFTEVVTSVIDYSGTLRSKYRVYPSDPECGNEFCYWETDVGPRFCIDCRDCPPPRLKGAEGDGCNQIIPGTKYYAHAGCTWDPVKEEYGAVFDWEIETLPFMDAVVARLDAIAESMDVINLIPYRVCDEKPKLAPHWRSIRFEEKELRDGSKRRIDKLLRYRGKEPGELDALAEHWADFEWDTGPVCVYHKGSPVGDPQVWADSEEEGKRVLRHAFREAGFDADQVGQWRVSGSANPRYGVRTRVGLKCIDGCWSITARPGPDGWPEAPITFPDP